MAKKKKIRRYKLLPKYVWVVAYIDNDQIDRCEELIRKYEEFDKVTPYIPTVKVLKKTFKNKNEFENVPLLFNYGFFKMPKKYLKNPEFFVNFKEKVPIIYQWVKDLSASLSLGIKSTAKEKEIRKKKRKKPKKAVNYLSYSLATQTEIDILKIEAAKTTIYDHNDLENIQKGSHIILKGYPWEDMEAFVKHIDHKKEEVKVELVLDDFSKELKVSFHNVFYSIYQGGHKVEPIRAQYLEDMKYKSRKISSKDDES